MWLPQLNEGEKKGSLAPSCWKLLSARWGLDDTGGEILAEDVAPDAADVV